MNTYEASNYITDQSEQYKRRAFQADLLKLTVAIVAELVIFLLWFDGPARERYEILVQIALSVCIVLPLINYRYLIVVPFIAFLPDVARAFDVDISHSLAILPLVFVAAFLPFIRRPKTVLIAAYAATAVCASHLIVDARKYAIIESFSGYPWSDLVLYALLLTVLLFCLRRSCVSAMTIPTGRAMDLETAVSALGLRSAARFRQFITRMITYQALTQSRGHREG